jgi:hypothetical protein
MPPDHYGSGSYQSLTPLPADDRARPPSAAGLGDRSFLPPAGYSPPAQVEQRFGGLGQESPSVRDEDSEPTNPLPVILPGKLPVDRPGKLPVDLPGPLPVGLPGAASIPRPAQIDAPRGPFEPARPARETSVTGSVEPPASPLNGDPRAENSFQYAAPGGPAVGSEPSVSDDLVRPVGVPPDYSIPEAASAKLEQIRDLYLTAEAIGEDALDKHFDQVSQRQRELIKEFFDRTRPEDDDPQ